MDEEHLDNQSTKKALFVVRYPIGHSYKIEQTKT